MYRISVEQHFDAAHYLRGYGGKCEALHGHNWKIEVLISSEGLGAQGMLMDFKELKNG